jgi:hypothetical protein
MRSLGEAPDLFATVSELRRSLLDEQPATFVSRYVFEPVPFVFRGDLNAWVDWKHKLAIALEVDPRDIVLTGSAAVGWSLNPDKGFRAFDDGSDIDCGIISAYHFDVAWRLFRRQRVAWLTLPPTQRDAIKSHRKNYIFSGTIATDWVLALLPFGGQWQNGLDIMSRTTPTDGRDVKLRIYKDFDSLRFYHTRNIENLRRDLASSNIPGELEETAGIPTED